MTSPFGLARAPRCVGTAWVGGVLGQGGEFQERMFCGSTFIESRQASAYHPQESTRDG
jgi:hypothetical protein